MASTTLPRPPLPQSSARTSRYGAQRSATNPTPPSFPRPPIRARSRSPAHTMCMRAHAPWRGQRPHGHGRGHAHGHRGDVWASVARPPPPSCSGQASPCAHPRGLCGGTGPQCHALAVGHEAPTTHAPLLSCLRCCCINLYVCRRRYSIHADAILFFFPAQVVYRREAPGVPPTGSGGTLYFSSSSRAGVALLVLAVAARQPPCQSGSRGC